MQQLLYAPEVRTIADLGIETAPVRDTELALAKQLIGQISSEQFDPGAIRGRRPQAHRDGGSEEGGRRANRHFAERAGNRRRRSSI